MTEWTWFILTGLAVSLATYFLWLSQNTKSQKAWLLKQLQSPTNDQQLLLEALDNLNKKPVTKHFGLLAIILLITPMALMVQNLWFDNQTPPQVSQDSTGDTQPPDLASAIKQLELKLAENPDDIQGQLLYAQSMVAMKRYDVASNAYEKANELQPNDAALLTEWAEAIAFKNNTGSFLGQPSELLEQAISIDPKHQKAMWLYGIVLYEQQQFAESESMWTNLMAMVDSPGVKNTLLKQINQARTAQGKEALATASNSAATDLPVLFNTEINIDGDETEIPSDAVLIVFAKSTDGMPMPIAAKKMNGPLSWPMTVTLSDSDSLQSSRLLSQFESVQVSALISLSGAIEDKQWQSDTITTESNNKITLKLKRLEP